MNTLRVIKNNWKKSVLLSSVIGYGVSTLKTNIEIKRYMNELSSEVIHCSPNSDVSPKKILVVVNPIANNKKAETMFKRYCEPVLHLAGFSVEILRTNHIGHAKAFVEEMNKLPDVIVVAGGEGTRSEVITGLLRRPGEKCAISFLPLGTERQSNFQISSKYDVEFVKTLCKALMPLLKNQFKYENVIQYDVLSNPISDATVHNLKPIFGLNGFSWGLLKDIDALKDKYWYLGPLKYYIAAISKSFIGNSNWNLETEYVYTPPCPGCSNCSQNANVPSAGFFLTNFVKPQNINRQQIEKQYKNESCSTKLYGFSKSNQINITLGQNDENFAELESKFINSLQPGWDFIKNIPNITNKTLEPNLILKSRTIKLYPAESTSNIYYSIDGEEYEPRPIKVSIVPNAIKVFC